MLNKHVEGEGFLQGEQKEWTRDRQTIDKTWTKLRWAATASDVQTERLVLRFCIQFVFSKKHKIAKSNLCQIMIIEQIINSNH